MTHLESLIVLIDEAARIAGSANKLAKQLGVPQQRIATVVWLWIMYLIIKAAVRNGVLEANRELRPLGSRSQVSLGHDDFRATR